MPAFAICGGLAHEARDAGSGHLEGEHLVDDRADRSRRVELERGAEDVAVEDHVEVLVGGDPDHDPVGDGVVGVAPGVAVRDPRRELLEGDVRETAQRVGRLAVVPLLELRHAAALEQDRIDVAGHREVVAQDDRVPALLGRPAADPVDPRAVAAPEHPVDEPVVRGQVVLGEQVDLERGLGHAGEPRLFGGPRILVEVAPQPIRDVVVREPLLRHARVTVVQPARLGLELDQERAFVIGHRRSVIGAPGRSPRVTDADLHGPASGRLCAMRTVTATRYVTALREGGSLPGLVEADDDGLYVVKFHGAGQGPRALVAEWLGGELGRAHRARRAGPRRRGARSRAR